MSRKYFLILLLLIFLFSSNTSIFAQNTNETYLEDIEEKRLAILWRVGDLLTGIVSGHLGIAAELQILVERYFSLSVIPLFAANLATEERVMVTGGEVGFVIHPFGNGLQGIYVGLYPGLYYYGHYREFQENISLEVGYQWVFTGGLTIAIGGRGGYQYLRGIDPVPVPLPGLNIGIGYAF